MLHPESTLTTRCNRATRDIANRHRSASKRANVCPVPSCSAPTPLQPLRTPLRHWRSFDNHRTTRPFESCNFALSKLSLVPSTWPGQVPGLNNAMDGSTSVENKTTEGQDGRNLNHASNLHKHKKPHPRPNQKHKEGTTPQQLVKCKTPPKEGNGQARCLSRERHARPSVGTPSWSSSPLSLAIVAAAADQMWSWLLLKDLRKTTQQC